ncbi:efflux RND transporter periplasmic adaptor subunit [Photobacterium leiognathi]|uniref:efflux RND transporter periplasmic adaptor subunit n=1 Tax=Photobacterium leiognathi TaxID=553611 RepID=UPI001EDF61C7|nr:efflux RND transporter periplasmic adaptor subunit [Photobacterium leiognathi]MCG3887320.1 efflux RND transporter periplasmic adaptor subunit [Photobacterium leiognathi]
MQWITKPSLALYVIFSTALVTGCDSSEKNENSESQQILSVNTHQLKQQDNFAIEREYVGFVQAGQQANLGFELNGKIDTIYVDVGDTVKKGDPLLTLDTQLLATEADQLRAQQAQISAQLELVNANLKRQKSLKAKGFSAASEIDNLTSQRKELQASIRQLSATLAANQLRLMKSTIVAPYNGVISARHVSYGDVVNAGSPTVTLLANNNKEVHIGIPIDKVSGVLAQKQWTVRVGKHAYPVKLLNPGATVGLNNRAINFRFSLPADAKVINGELAYLNYDDTQPQSGFWVPLSALTDGIRGTWNIFAVTENGAGPEVERRSVQLLYAANDKAFIQGAVQNGEQIIANGLHRLVPGQIVTIKPQIAPKQKTATNPTNSNDNGV